MPEFRGTVVEMPDLGSSDKPGVIRTHNGTMFHFRDGHVPLDLRDTLKVGAEIDFSVRSLQEKVAAGILRIHPPREDTMRQPPPHPSEVLNGESDYFYVVGGQRHGPVSMASLENLFRSGRISEKSLVWTKEFGSDWREYARVSTRGADEPPMVPVQAIQNSWFYLLIAAPLLMSFVELFIMDTRPALLSGGFALFALYVVPNVILCFLDERSLRASGRHHQAEGLFAWGALLVPVYVAKRGRRTDMGFIPLLFWIGAFAFGLYITGNFPIGEDVYWGLGLPSCESSISVSMVKDLYLDLPINFAGVEATGVTAIAESSHNAENGVRTCKAIVQSAVGADLPVNYTITEQGNEFYFELQYGN